MKVFTLDVSIQSCQENRSRYNTELKYEWKGNVANRLGDTHGFKSFDWWPLKAVIDNDVTSLMGLPTNTGMKSSAWTRAKAMNIVARVAS